MKGLFLDDERNPKDVTWLSYPEDVEWTIVRNSTEFIAMVIHNNYDIVSFDHDIQEFHKGKETTGYDILKTYINGWFDHNQTKLVFHTKNIIGKNNMEQYYQNYLNFVENN